MHDFYRVTDALSRPRVFAIAVPPTEHGFHFDSAMLKLEATLHSKVFGVSAEKRQEILALPDRPNEFVILYDRTSNTVEGRLLRQLELLDPSCNIFRKHFNASRLALSDVGSCASDLIWRRALKDIEVIVQPSYVEEDEEGQSVPMIQRQIRDTVKNWTFMMPNLDASSRGFNVTPKFLKLVQTLKSCKFQGAGFRGIVFVQRHATALVIVDILRTLDEQLVFLRPCALVGHGPLSTPEHQQEILHNFAAGSCNLLIATKSAEDLDVPKASIVIRFDIFDSQVSHAYVRSCTRGRESHLVHMIERNNEVHRHVLSKITQLDVEMLRWTEVLATTVHSAVPPHTLQETTQSYPSGSEDEEDPHGFIQDPIAGGRIYLQDATRIIYRVAASLVSHNTGVSVGQSIFKFDHERREFGTPRTYLCTILLPGTPANGISGSPSISRAHARRTACYKACEALVGAGIIDYRLFPIPPDLFHNDTIERLPSLNLTDKKISGTRLYQRKEPEFWTNIDTEPLTLLYPTIISTSDTGGSARTRAPFLILTRKSLPDLTSFNLFCSAVPTRVNFRRAAVLEVDADRLHDLHLYTVRLVRVISNKPYACEIDKMVYFFAPLTMEAVQFMGVSRPFLSPPNVVEFISWDLVTLAGHDHAISLKIGSLEELQCDVADAVIQDNWVEFTRRYETVRIRPDLTPLSKPLDSPREAEYESLVDFCKARRKGFEGLKDYDQPIIEVSKIPASLNHLNPVSQLPSESSKSPAKYLIPELCAKSTIPASTLHMALLLPSITRRIDDFLLVKELNTKYFDNTISEELLYMAICAPSAAVEHDYERLELLGDAFLKYLSTVYVFVTYPASSEGELHAARMTIISNKTLLQCACNIDLPIFIQAKPFASKAWHPPNFYISPTAPPHSKSPVETPKDVDIAESSSLQLPMNPVWLAQSDLKVHEVSDYAVDQKKKKQNRLSTTQFLGDKAIADVAEAIIGAAYISGGREVALNVTKALGVPIPNIRQWSDFGRKARVPPQKITAKLKPKSIEEVEAIIGHKFARPYLLAQALTHPSIQGFESTSYERLEFVGDAVLDFMVIRHIYDRDQQLSPGGLTLLKSAMVSNSALAAICVWSGLHEHLLYESYILATSIQEYVTAIKTKQDEEYRAAEREDRPPGQYWLEIEPPKAISDVLESIAGAIYISDDFSPVGVEALFDNVLKPFYDKHITLKTPSYHPTKVLFELFQAQGCHQFKIIKRRSGNNTLCYVIVHDVILSSGEDLTPTIAARRASLSALDALEGDTSFVTRTCDCHTLSKRKQKKSDLEYIIQNLEDSPSENGKPSRNTLSETEFGEDMILGD
ncbi:hypothetical protein BDZ94DRAFT_1208489 [Collybia nuda]|uniref:Uncharacterized protein n=1 Tax=Collybia nuda TaxID=64659 RepID=A0A9P5YK83_9AGAR|nr:hypothetical protein BDZ94DRAFT_1208489 [Collybia nuda]